MKILVAAPLPALALASLVLAALEPACQERESSAASALFQETCIGCHVPPDPAFATERAWLDQVAHTA